MEKKNLDYASSAVNLNNPEQVNVLAGQVFIMRNRLAELADLAKAYIPKDITNEIEFTTKEIAVAENILKQLIYIIKG